MESESLLTLTDETWRSLEHLNDVLAGDSNLQRAFATGVDILLTVFKRRGVALYLPRFCEHITVDWTLSRVPSTWNSALDGSHSPLIDIVDQVMQTGETCPGVDVLNLGAAFPVQAGGRTIGVLLVSGQVVARSEYPFWEMFLRPFARTVQIHAQASGNIGGIPAYRELMNSRNTLRAMFDSLPISIYIIGNNYNLVAVNESRAARVGERPNHLVGRKCYEKLYNRSVPCPGCRVIETFGPGQPTRRISRDTLDADRFVEWEISTFPIFDEKNIAVQAIVIEQDATDKRNLEANLIQSEKLAAVGQLAAGVAHEINNPLTAIIANAQILRREIPLNDPDLLESVKLIEMAGTRASQVVRNLLGIARKEKYEFEPVDLNETLHNALSLVQHELLGRPIQIYLNLDDDMPTILASQDQIQGVWINLLLNAIDAIDKETGEISVSAGFSGNQFQVEIIDNGKGIPTEHLSRVFEPFFTTKSPGRGTGLGLSVCMRVIRHHGGMIQVDSQPGKWTKFTVTLPGPA
jgi:two-component system NtrC family sensor kinase